MSSILLYKASVENYFTSKNIKKTGNWELYSKALVLVPSAVAIYIILLTTITSCIAGHITLRIYLDLFLQVSALILCMMPVMEVIQAKNGLMRCVGPYTKCSWRKCIHLEIQA